MGYEQVVTLHKSHYRSLLAQGLWPSSTENKSSEQEISGLRAEINKLSQNV